MNSDVEFHIRQNYPWNKLPANIKQILGNSQREYEKNVVTFSIRNQLRYKGNLVRTIKKDEKKYYEILVQYSREHLMLYPYHLSDVMVKGLRITPFTYYTNMMTDIMTQDKSYDSLPNFTAADCLRLLGIGRNQYIDLMNQTRTSKATRIFRKKPTRDLLPSMPIENIAIEHWWTVQAGYITEDDVKSCNTGEKDMIDFIIDSGSLLAASLDYKILNNLYRKGLVYLDVVIGDEDCIVVPPLEGFVMNRVLGDYFETLLYKIFVSIDEHTNVAELANVLQIDLQLVKNAVSMYCRLGFARRKGSENLPEDIHPSWNITQCKVSKKPAPEELLIDWSSGDPSGDSSPQEKTASTPDDESAESIGALMNNAGHSKRIAFLFDSTLTAFLMMGNLSPGLKSHAVTMFEVGKLSDESLDSFLAELEKVDSTAEGEAQRYFDHAITLRDTVKFLRFNKSLTLDPELTGGGLGVDLLRCESLLGLDPGTCARLLNKNYSLLVSMAPLSNEIRPVSSCTPHHIGPAIPEVSSVWFKLFIYKLTGCGPPTLLLCKGTKLRRLPKVLQCYEKLLITTWGHDPAVIATSNVLLTLNDALTHSAVLVQAHGWQTDGATLCIPFPIMSEQTANKQALSNHSAIKKLSSCIDIDHSCGFITLLKTGMPANLTNSMLQSVSHLTSSMGNRSPSLDDASQASDKPTNGIKDSKSAEILANELDSLNSLAESPSSKPSSLDIYLEDTDSSIADTSCEESCDIAMESDWVLLDCYFGIPLFDSHVNKEVCDRIVSRGICTRDSLQELLHSGRKLALSLLDFITEYQETSIGEDAGGSPLLDDGQSTKSSDLLPYPTCNLIFNHGALEKWMGR